jgi:hypothetical protein
VLKADVFRPVGEGRYPVILTYALRQGVAFQDVSERGSAWPTNIPTTAGSSNLYQSWEVVYPEKWVARLCLRARRLRGCGVSGLSIISRRARPRTS